MVDGADAGWPRCHAGNIVDPDFGDEPMLAIEGAAVGVKLMPLLSKQLEVSRVELDGLRLNLRRRADGTSNWDDLVGSEEAPAEPPAEAGAAPAFDIQEIAGIGITDVAVVYDDEAAGETCDDGNDSNEDACLETCEPNTCGDGFVNPDAEACDEGDDNGAAKA